MRNCHISCKRSHAFLSRMHTMPPLMNLSWPQQTYSMTLHTLRPTWRIRLDELTLSCIENGVELSETYTHRTYTYTTHKHKTQTHTDQEPLLSCPCAQGVNKVSFLLTRLIHAWVLGRYIIYVCVMCICCICPERHIYVICILRSSITVYPLFCGYYARGIDNVVLACLNQWVRVMTACKLSGSAVWRGYCVGHDLLVISETSVPAWQVFRLSGQDLSSEDG